LVSGDIVRHSGSLEWKEFDGEGGKRTRIKR
jgi:hypothetical protein